MSFLNCFRLALVASFLTLLAACGGPPKVLNSTVKEGVSNSKVTSIAFVYQEVDLKTTQTYGTRSASVDMAGIGQFGSILVKQAKASFAKSNVDVLLSTSVEKGRWKSAGQGLLASIPAAQRVGASLITVFPVSGRATSDNKGDQILLSFEVRLLDFDAGKLRWVGHIETNTWSGKGLYEGAQKVTFDEVYAEQFFSALVDQLRNDKLIW